jgi:hypothetical protein
MRVHVIRSADFSAHTYQAVLQILRQYQGPVEFMASESDAHISNAIAVEIESKEAFELAQEPKIVMANMMDSVDNATYSMSERPRISFPHKTKKPNGSIFLMHVHTTG